MQRAAAPHSMHAPRYGQANVQLQTNCNFEFSPSRAVLQRPFWAFRGMQLTSELPPRPKIANLAVSKDEEANEHNAGAVRQYPGVLCSGVSGKLMRKSLPRSRLRVQIAVQMSPLERQSVWRLADSTTRTLLGSNLWKKKKK